MPKEEVEKNFFNFSSPSRSRRAACAAGQMAPHDTTTTTPNWALVSCPQGNQPRAGKAGDLLHPPLGVGLMLPQSNGTGFPRKHENMRTGLFQEGVSRSAQRSQQNPSGECGLWNLGSALQQGEI